RASSRPVWCGPNGSCAACLRALTVTVVVVVVVVVVVSSVDYKTCPHPTALTRGGKEGGVNGGGSCSGGSGVSGVAYKTCLQPTALVDTWEASTAVGNTPR
ncbi:unnamed protein product, partial [Laminaria digitata]